MSVLHASLNKLGNQKHNTYLITIEFDKILKIHERVDLCHIDLLSPLGSKGGVDDGNGPRGSRELMPFKTVKNHAVEIIHTFKVNVPIQTVCVKGLSLQSQQRIQLEDLHPFVKRFKDIEAVEIPSD